MTSSFNGVPRLGTPSKSAVMLPRGPCRKTSPGLANGVGRINIVPRQLITIRQTVPEKPLTCEFPDRLLERRLICRSTHRPNGPGDPSPGLRPEADALGKGRPHLAAWKAARARLDRSADQCLSHRRHGSIPRQNLRSSHLFDEGPPSNPA